MPVSTPSWSRARPRARSLNFASKFFFHRSTGSKIWPSASTDLPKRIIIPPLCNDSRSSQPCAQQVHSLQRRVTGGYQNTDVGFAIVVSDITKKQKKLAHYLGESV